MIKKLKTKAKLRKGKADGVMGLGPEDKDPDGPNSDDLNLQEKRTIPSSRWDKVTADEIGEGFEVVDFDEKPKLKDARLVFKRFKNRFVIGQSKFITYDVKHYFVPFGKNAKAPKEINAHTKVTKTERRLFVSKLGGEIEGLRDLFVKDLLPITLAVQSSVEEIKDKMDQLVDDKIALPADYIRARAYQAVQIRISRYLSERFGLTDSESRALMPEILRVEK